MFKIVRLCSFRCQCWLIPWSVWPQSWLKFERTLKWASMTCFTMVTWPVLCFNPQEIRFLKKSHLRPRHWQLFFGPFSLKWLSMKIQSLTIEFNGEPNATETWILIRPNTIDLCLFLFNADPAMTTRRRTTLKGWSYWGNVPTATDLRWCGQGLGSSLTWATWWRHRMMRRPTIWCSPI